MGSGWTNHLVVSLRYGLGAPVVVAALIGSAWLARTAPAIAAVAVSFPVAYYLVIGAGRTVLVRYIDPLLPFGCMLAAVAIARAALSVERVAGGRTAKTVAVLLTGAVVFPSVDRSVAFDRLVAKRDNRLLVADWLDSSVPPSATICQIGSVYGLLESWPAGRFPQCVYDEQSRTFRVMGSPGSELPQFVVIQRSSPLRAYPGFPEALLPVLRSSYRSIKVFAVEQPRPRAAAHLRSAGRLFCAARRIRTPEPARPDLRSLPAHAMTDISKSGCYRHQGGASDSHLFSVPSAPSPLAPGADPPRNSFLPPGSVMFLPTASFDRSLD